VRYLIVLFIRVILGRQEFLRNFWILCFLVVLLGFWFLDLWIVIGSVGLETMGIVESADFLGFFIKEKKS
jgi:hypothetical protein